MNDSEIVELYWARKETAIGETSRAYGAYCRSISRNIVGDSRDAEECLSDTWLAAWNSIPPQRPALLRAYLGKITRRLSLKKWREKHAQKRGGGEVALALDELAECIPDGGGPEEALDAQLLTEAVNRFLAGLDGSERRVFICRYWYLDPLKDICHRFGYSQSKVKSMLHRLRQRLRLQLEREGYFDEE